MMLKMLWHCVLQVLRGPPLAQAEAVSHTNKACYLSMAAGAKLPPLADEMKPPPDPVAQQRGIAGKAKHLLVRLTGMGAPSKRTDLKEAQTSDLRLLLPRSLMILLERFRRRHTIRFFHVPCRVTGRPSWPQASRSCSLASHPARACTTLRPRREYVGIVPLNALLCRTLRIC